MRESTWKKYEVIHNGRDIAKPEKVDNLLVPC